MRLMPGIFPLSLLAVVAACASRPLQTAQCATATIDSAWLDAGPLYTACTVDDTARLRSAQLRDPDFVRHAGQTCYSALLEFVVGPSGVPENGTVRVVRSTSSDFARALVAVAPTLRFEPARSDGYPVRQVVRWGMAHTVLLTPLINTAGGRRAGPPARPCTP